MSDRLDSAHERLEWARVRAGYRDKAQFAQVVGVHPTTYRAYENGQNGFAKLAAQFAKKLGVSAEWLLEGGPLPVESPPPEPDTPPTRTADAGETVDIVALDLSVSMGPGTEIEDFVESEPVKFDAAMLRSITLAPPNRLRIIRGIGTSMEPVFQSNDRFLIDTTVRDLSRFDGYYWITIDGAHGLKRLRPSGDGMWRVISENPAFEDFDIDKRAVRIEGRAVWVARGL